MGIQNEGEKEKKNVIFPLLIRLVSDEEKKTVICELTFFSLCCQHIWTNRTNIIRLIAMLPRDFNPKI